MLQWLRVHAALAEDQSAEPSTHVWLLIITTCNSMSRRPNTSGSTDTQTHILTGTHTHHILTLKRKYFFVQRKILEVSNLVSLLATVTLVLAILAVLIEQKACQSNSQLAHSYASSGHLNIAHIP